jgi:sugar phosphate isomerase/epimerase
MVHVKDSFGPPDYRMADVGAPGAKGIDFKRIFAWNTHAGIRHYFVEHDEPRDALASIKASYDYLKRLEF